jgi:hypothetical protein
MNEVVFTKHLVGALNFHWMLIDHATINMILVSLIIWNYATLQLFIENLISYNKGRTGCLTQYSFLHSCIDVLNLNQRFN